VVGTAGHARHTHAVAAAAETRCAGHRRTHCIDIDTGQQLWQWELPTAAMATPMTYEVDGRQFVVVAAGGHHAYYRQKVGDTLMAFALVAE